METKKDQSFDEVARLVLYDQEFQRQIKGMMVESPKTDEFEILYLLIQEVSKRMGYDLNTEKGRKDTQRLVKKSLLNDIRRIFKLAQSSFDQTSHQVSQSVHHLIPLEETSDIPETHSVVRQNGQMSDKPTSITPPPKANFIQILESFTGPQKKLLEFISRIQKITTRASEGDPKQLWTNRFKKEQVSLESESSAWKEQFEDLAKTPFSEEFFQEHPELQPIKEDTLRIQELASLVKGWYAKTISPVVIVRIGRENINPYKTPNFYKLTIEEVIDFMKGKKSAKEYLGDLSQVHKYTLNAIHKKNLGDILKKN